jgi:hypothetical protein
MNAPREYVALALVLGAAVVADAGQPYLATDRFLGSIHRLEDVNGDGDALDAGERFLWGTGLSNAAELTAYESGILVLDSVADRALYFEDINLDGDALDAGESVPWSEGFTNPFGIDVGPDGSVFLSDFATHQVFRARDINADGDALDTSEKLLYAENIQGAVSILASGNEQYVVAFNSGQVHQLRDTNGDGDALDVGENLPHTPNSIPSIEGIAHRSGGGYFTGSWFNDTIYRVVDKNGDGDALDQGEVLSYADNVFGRFSDPWGMAVGPNNELLVANSAGANVLALRDKNNDGDALDVGETVVFADGISAPVDIVALPIGLPGDFNLDGAVNAADYVVWVKGVVPSTPANYNLWRTNFGRTTGGGHSAITDPNLRGAVPEPSIVVLVCLGIAGFGAMIRGR